VSVREIPTLTCVACGCTRFYVGLRAEGFGVFKLVVACAEAGCIAEVDPDVYDLKNLPEGRLRQVLLTEESTS
jgi:hypothetical protein